MTDPAPVPASGPSARWTTTVDGRKLRQLRRLRRLTQKQLAQQAGISQATVTRLEGPPRASCRCRTLARLAAALGEEPARLTPATRS
jgi:transcriptional regulator with XRE-family HTH domain